MSKKIPSEKETRSKFLNIAKAQGCEMELRQLFDKYDKLLKNNPDPESRKQVQVLATVELYKLLNMKGGLAVGDQQIIPHNPKDDELDFMN